MDLNYLYQRHQVSLVMAERADTAQARRIHREFAELYGARIAEARLSRTHLRAV
jgi:hypothetical protein